MLNPIARIVDKITDTVAAMRTTLSANVPDGTSAYRADFVQISVPAPEYVRLADQLVDARRVIEQDAEREAKLRDRISRLESSNGALMVDRQRGIDAAHLVAEGARQVAKDSLATLREHGIEPGADLATLIEDANRWRHQHEKFLADERDRLEAFRCSIVGLIQQCQTQAANGKGLTPGQVSKLGQAIERANNKAYGR